MGEIGPKSDNLVPIERGREIKAQKEDLLMKQHEVLAVKLREMMRIQGDLIARGRKAENIEELEEQKQRLGLYIEQIFDALAQVERREPLAEDRLLQLLSVEW